MGEYIARPAILFSLARQARFRVLKCPRRVNVVISGCYERLTSIGIDARGLHFVGPQGTIGRELAGEERLIQPTKDTGCLT